MSAASKRRWREDPLNRKQEANAHRLRRTPAERLQENIRDTLRYTRNRIED